MAVSIRMCLVCRRRQPKRQLLKIAVSASGEVKIDVNQNMQSRGAYVCFDPKCLKEVANPKKLNRAFHQEVSPYIAAKFKVEILEFQTQSFE